MTSRLILGDCLDVMRDIPDGSVDMVLADPPYGTTACKWDSVIPFAPMWEQLKRVTKRNGAIVLTASQPFTSALVMSNVKMFKQELTWVKNKSSGHLNAKIRHMTKHENVLLFGQGKTPYIPQKTTGHAPSNTAVNRKPTNVYGSQVPTAYGGSKERYPTTLLDFPVVNNDGSKDGGRCHPTQKPVALMEYLIRTYTNEGETVLDFTMGSGTTGVAAKNLNRDFIGIEMDETYFNIAKARIDDE